jgi:hypothetical protein
VSVSVDSGVLEVAPLAQDQANVPLDLAEVILRCLAKKPEDRFQDADSLGQALQECAGAERWSQADAAHWWRQHEHGQEELSPAATA